MTYTIHTEEYKNHTIEIWQDDCPVNPYEDWDMLGTFYHWHKRGFIGEDISRWDSEDIQQHFKDIKSQGGIVLPIYLYEHSGQTIRTTPFGCAWDSGQVGFYAVEGHTIRKEYSKKRISKQLREKVTQCLTCEIETIDQWLRGDVYGFSILDKDGETTDSCGGFYGDYEGYLMAEAKSQIDWQVKEARKQRFERLKTLIRNGVPLHRRDTLLTF